MELKINGKNCELNFGVRFVRELDKVAGVSSKGISLGMALTRTLPALETYDPVALSNVIYAGAYANSPRPTLDDTDKFVCFRYCFSIYLIEVECKLKNLKA